MGLAVTPAGRPRKKTNTKNLPEKLKKLVDTIKEYKDPKGRQLSIIFMKLPNQKEFPDYYEVIKRPMDLFKISTKLASNAYNSVEECQSDMVLVFDNACKFNEPDSQIYKGNLTDFLKVSIYKIQKNVHEIIISSFRCLDVTKFSGSNL